jgi:hypothetical protein
MDVWYRYSTVLRYLRIQITLQPINKGVQYTRWNHKSTASMLFFILCVKMLWYWYGYCKYVQATATEHKYTLQRPPCLDTAAGGGAERGPVGGDERILELPGERVQHKYRPEPEHHMLRLPHNLLQQGLRRRHLQQRVPVGGAGAGRPPLPRYAHRRRAQARPVRVDIGHVDLGKGLAIKTHPKKNKKNHLKNPLKMCFFGFFWGFLNF